MAVQRYHEPQIELIDIPHYPNPGRPTKEQLPTRIGFQVVGQVVEQPQTIEQAKNNKGKFVLATNELDAISLDDATILSAYKGQNVSVERGFRFLKDPLFFCLQSILRKTATHYGAFNGDGAVVTGLCASRALDSL